MYNEEGYTVFDEIEDKKKYYSQNINTFNKMVEVCDIILQPDYKKDKKKCYKGLKVSLLVMAEIESSYDQLIKSINFRKFKKNYDRNVNFVKDFTKGIIALTEEEIEKLNEEKMNIDNYVYPDLFKSAEEDVEYQSNKTINVAKRKQILDDFDKNYN